MYKKKSCFYDSLFCTMKVRKGIKKIMVMPTARIYKPNRHTMQVGRAKTRQWLLEYAPSGSRFLDPLMKWTSSTQTQTQLHLKFPTQEAAIRYAEKNDISYGVIPQQVPLQQDKSYADNFANSRLK